MRKTILFLTTLTFFIAARSQELPDVSSIKLDKKEDFNSNANNAALKVSVYLLTTPVQRDDANRALAQQFLIRWMKGTPEFYFNLDEDAAELAKRSDDLFLVFMAAMTKYVLENPTDAADQKKIKQNSVRMLIQYAKNPKNNVSLESDFKII